MGAGLDDLAGIHNHQAVEHGDRRQTVGDGDDGAALHETVELLLDDRLHFGIERRGRLVEDEDRRVLENEAGDGDALALAARELDAALADQRVVAGAATLIDQVRDEIAGLGAAGGFGDLVVGGLGPAIADVVANGAMEERGVLRDDADLRAQAFLRDLGDVLAVDEDATPLEVVEAQQQIDQRRLAGAGAADQPDPFTGLDGERQMVDEAARRGRSGSSHRRSGFRHVSRPAAQLPGDRGWRPGG